MSEDYKDMTREDLIRELESFQGSYESVMQAFGLSNKDIDASILKDYQARMTYLMTAAHIAWWDINLADSTIAFDLHQAEMLGFLPKNFKKYQDFTDLIHPDDHDLAIQSMTDHLAGKRKFYDVEYRFMTTSGSYAWLRDVGSIASLNPDGTPQRIAGVVIDITGQKKAEEEARLKAMELEEANKEKDKFLSFLAHDLRNPMSSFLGFTNLLMADIDKLSMDDIRDMARLMNTSAFSLYRLLETLLEWSRMQRGMIPFEPVLIKLSGEMEIILGDLFSDASKKEITIRCNIDKNLPVYADRNMLKSILRNLVFNALKFTRRGGQVEITAVEGNDGFVTVQVTDNGIGMNETLLSNLFRLDADTKRLGTEDEPTSGLGLILCKEFVEKHGGKIWATSDVEKGSTFYFTMPVSESFSEM